VFSYFAATAFFLKKENIYQIWGRLPGGMLPVYPFHGKEPNPLLSVKEAGL
jgi:hypothetical protein